MALPTRLGALLTVALLAACPPQETPDAGTPDAGPLPHAYPVHVFANGASSWELHWFDGTAWAAGPVPLDAGATWWTGTFTGFPGAQFSLKANGEWYPGGTTTYHPSPAGTWLKDGLVFPYEPTGARPADVLTVLTVNLHTYQETEPLQRLAWVADVIARADVDLVAFQECAQRRDAPVAETLFAVPLREDNMARLIVADLAARYGKTYTYAWDWSHYGFTWWEEGSAVLGRGAFTFLEHEARYVSTGTGKSDINSRMALYGAWSVPGLGRVHLFSTHLSWGGPQPAQLTALTTFADEKADAGPALTLLTGDFNANTDGDGYRQLVADGGWLDSAREAAPATALEPTLGAERIDYQFRNAGSRLVPVLTQRVFLQLTAPEAAHQRVSDHVGVLVHYRLAR